MKINISGLHDIGIPTKQNHLCSDRVIATHTGKWFELDPESRS
jgi:hypothetical protein